MHWSVVLRFERWENISSRIFASRSPPRTPQNLHTLLYIYDDLYLDLYLNKYNLGILKVFTAKDPIERHLNMGSRYHQKLLCWVAGDLSPELAIMHLCAQLIRRQSSEYKGPWKVYHSRNTGFLLNGAYNLTGEIVSLCMKLLHITEKVVMCYVVHNGRF